MDDHFAVLDDLDFDLMLMDAQRIVALYEKENTE